MTIPKLSITSVYITSNAQLEEHEGCKYYMIDVTTFRWLCESDRSTMHSWRSIKYASIILLMVLHSGDCVNLIGLQCTAGGASRMQVLYHWCYYIQGIVWICYVHNVDLVGSIDRNWWISVDLWDVMYFDDVSKYHI